MFQTDFVGLVAKSCPGYYKPVRVVLCHCLDQKQVRAYKFLVDMAVLVFLRVHTSIACLAMYVRSMLASTRMSGQIYVAKYIRLPLRSCTMHIFRSERLLKIGLCRDRFLNRASHRFSFAHTHYCG